MSTLATISAPPGIDQDPYWVGAETSSNYFKGWIDEITVHHRALTLAEITLLARTNNDLRCR